VIRRPPTRARPMTFAATVALTFVVTGGCTTRPPETLGGLVVAANGQVRFVSDAGEVEDIQGAPAGVRRATAATGRIVLEVDAGAIVVSDPPAAGAARSWRELTIDAGPGRSTTGIDLSLDGRTLAVVRGDPGTAGMEVLTLDVATGAATTRELDLMANGPPSWIGSGTLALEVVKPDQQVGIATLDTATGTVAITQASGFEASVTGDGSLVAVATEAGVVVRKTSDWLSVAPDGSVALPGSEGTTVLDVAIDAAGTRLAVAYADPSGASATIAILRRNGEAWDQLTSIEVPGDGPVVIDWLD
jgi:hypothetical protein